MKSCIIAKISLCFLLISFIPGCETKSDSVFVNSDISLKSKGLVPYDFNYSEFESAPREFGPFTRWWWPGNDVENGELKRELILFAENGFAGVEIQPFTYGLNFETSTSILEKQYSWDSPSYYAHLETVMEQAKNLNLVVDLSAGSGWPMGGGNIHPDSSLLTLAYADTILHGEQLVTLNIPRLKPDSSMTGEKRPGFMLFKYIDTSYAKLKAVVAAKIIGKEGNQYLLQEGTSMNLQNFVVGNKLTWQVPEGNWKLFSFWSIPDGETTKGMAARPQGLVVDHLDSNKLKVFYDHLFGYRTGLQKYYGNPFRAVFNDSYEFLPDRHFSNDFIEYFKAQRGYDVVPYLPANLQKGYNSAYGPVLFPNQKPNFVLSDQDWRIRYDYDLTVSELLKYQFLAASKNWLNSKGLLHRTQTYGAKMDVISNSGYADIPETEHLAGNNSEGFTKLITSGAHIFQKPIITQESFVFMGHAEALTPQKIKILADKSFAAGVNQIIYHGTPYKYQTGEFGEEGWSPFSSTFLPINFSGTINESSPFWKNIRHVNKYITSMQYALRSGKPKTDVVIYFPFIDLYPEQVINNPEEILHAGYFEGVEPLLLDKHEHNDNTSNWFRKIWPLINKLEAAGITWEFVNDKALQAAASQAGNLTINSNSYQALLVSEAPYMQLATAQKINELSTSGCKILFNGSPPVKQPSYFNWKLNDSIVAKLNINTLQQNAVTLLKNDSQLERWIKDLYLPVRFKQNYRFTRQIIREMSDGSRLHFIWNMSDKKQAISLLIDTAFSNSYWINTEDKSGVKVNQQRDLYNLPPYGSVILIAGKKELKHLPLPLSEPAAKSIKVSSIKNWNIKANDLEFTDTLLFDWRDNTQLKYVSTEAIYSSTFTLEKLNGKEFVLDLGKVFFTANVVINGQQADERIWAPYSLNVTKYVKDGQNSIEVRVTPTNRNKYIGEAIKGNAKYNQFKGKENTLLPSGLIGPVIISAY